MKVSRDLRVSLIFVTIMFFTVLVHTAVFAQGSSSFGVSVFLDKLPVRFPVAPYIDQDTTMVPLRALAEALGVKVDWEPTESRVLCTRQGTSVSIKIGDKTAFVNGRAVGLPKTAKLVESNTVVPLRFFSEAMGFVVGWDGETRTVSVTSPLGKTQVWGFYALGSTVYSSWQDAFGQEYPLESQESPAKQMAGLILGWYGVNSDGTVTDSGHPSGFSKPQGWESVLSYSQADKAQCLAMFYCDNKGEFVSGLLAEPASRQTLAASIASAAGGYHGVAIDFEGLGLKDSTALRDAQNFSLFLDELKELLGSRILAAVVPPQNGHFKGYDHQHIGEVSDMVIIMAYGYEDVSVPSATAPWHMVDEAIRMELDLVPSQKIVLGMPAYGTLYKTRGQEWELVSYPAAKDVFPSDSTQDFSPEDACLIRTWNEDSVSCRAYIETNESLQARISHAARYNLKGVAVWRLGLMASGWWDAVEQVVEPVR